ncbi:MAG: DUF2452 domain-containing protein [Myxococcota bacterium]
MADSDDKHQGPARTAPYALSTLSAPIRLVDVAGEIEKADHLIGAVTHSKLTVIAEQIRALQEQARAVLEGAQRDLELHRAECSFSRRPGHIYHLYRRANGTLLWSMVAPNEWGAHAPYEFVGSFRLEADQSWTPAEDLDNEPIVPQGDELIRKLLP